MRPLLTLGLALLAGCSFYAPVVADCTITCGEGGACPDGFTCRGTFCRPTTASRCEGGACRPVPGPTEDCACRPGATQRCGSEVGECRLGTQTCTAAGQWGECEGGVAPVPERCDGKDNDCDGLTDMGPIKTLLADNTGPFEGYWRLHGHAGGWVMVTPLALEDGGASYHALSFDPDFEPRGRSAPIVAGYWRRMDSMARGDSVYAAYSVGDDLQVSRIEPDGGVTAVRTITDAGYDGRVQVGVRGDELRVTWLTTTPSAQVMTWPADGGAPSRRELPALPEGTLWWLDATTDGQFVMLEASLPDGGYLDAVQHVDEATPRTLTAPYWRAARFMTRRSGTIVHLDVLDLMGATKVVFFRDFATQKTDEAMVVEEDGRWHDVDFVLSDTEDLIAAYVNDQTQQLVLARIEGTMASDQQVTRSVLTGVTVPVTTAAGNIRMGKVPGDPMYGLVWSTRREVLGRRVCAP